MKFTNYSDGPRGVNGPNGLVMIEKGESATVDGITDGEIASAMATGYFSEDGKPVTAKAPKAPKAEEKPKLASLKDANKARLLEIAADEKVEIPEVADGEPEHTNDDLKGFINAKREADKAAQDAATN